MNDISFELSSSSQSDFDTTPIKLPRIRHRQRLPPSVSPETAGQSSRKCRASRKCLWFKAYARFEPSRFTQPFNIQHHIVISSPLCVFLESKLNVQTNMRQSDNCQTEPEPTQSRPRGRFTGDRFLRERPRVYQKVVELLAEPGISINQITKLCRVSEHTVRAVRDREAVSIAERKQRLTSIFGNVAEMAAERMEELAGTASL